MYSTINDRPNNPKENRDDKDLLGITLYQKALEEFIKRSTTPMTIAIQGEWGSGKSSLMYYLNDALCADGGDFQGVWINSWEYALFNDDTGVLLQIVTDIIKSILGNDLEESNDKDRKAINNYLIKISKTLMFAVGRDYKFIDEITKRETEDKPDEEVSSLNISEIREKLENIINTRLKESTPSKKGILFFIDDLDRIEPTVAVRILEVLKNIFDIDKCIFVIAIDYDVVIKGLKPKYGEMTDNNEREFRSFFDKIIQVPYTMPVAEYKIDDFLLKSLKSINYFDDLKYDKKLEKLLSNFAMLSVGTNPRSIKRLINLLSLIKIIIDIKNDNENIKESNLNKNKKRIKDELVFTLEDRITLFAVVCIQLAYPKVYDFLRKETDLDEWNSLLLSRNSINWPKDDEINNIDKIIFKDKDSEIQWVRVLYVLTKEDPYLRANFLNIRDILNQLKEYISGISDKKDETVAIYLSNIMELSMVTEVSQKENKEKSVLKIGAQVKAFFNEVVNNSFIDQEVIDQFMENEYSKKNLNLNYPLLAKEREGDLKQRYWKTPITINKKTYYVCSQWYKGDQPYFDKWKIGIENHIEKNK